MKSNLTKVIVLAMLLTISIVASLLDSLVPIPIKGVKLGVGNVVILLMIYKYRVKETLLVLILRILMVSFLRGNFLSITFYMSLSGGLLSFITMLLCSKIKILDVIVVSVFGAIFHCVGQIAVSIISLSTVQLIYYLPLMIILSVLTGILTGYLSKHLIKRFDFKKYV